MKLKNIFLAGLSAVALGSCSDYLDVDAPSKLPPEYVYSDKKEINRALNGVYAAMLTGDTYGEKFLNAFSFSTDVEFADNGNMYATSNGYKRYDCDPDGGDIKKIWDALYAGIERANMLDAGIKESDIYNEEDAELMQMLGEVKVLRAIFYHDLVWYFGDVPYSLLPSYKAPSAVYDVADRTKILSDLIDDLKAIAPYMTMTTEQGFQGGCERIGKEMAWAMISRLALTAGGYSLRPDGENIGRMQRPDNYLDFYKTAADYADSVIVKSHHALRLDYHKVFVNECNFVLASGDDPIFEIPFAKESTGSIGYIHGPKMDNSAGTTVHAWGKASSSSQLSALYRFMFDDDDARREYVNQLFSYNNQGEANLNNGRTNYNGKWSKLWNTSGLGATTEGSTGINFPYMRYADVLLMYAEAANEINNGPTATAIERFEQVRERAFRNTNPAKIAKPESYGTKEDFLKAILDERKFEFAGENMRWRDLVRNNMLAENVYWSFFRYFNAGEGNGQYSDALDQYDFNGQNSWAQKLIFSLYYYNNVRNDGYLTEAQFPQTSDNMNVVRILNPYRQPTNDDSKVRMDIDGKSTAPARADYMSWFDDNLGLPRQELLYCLRGYVYCDVNDGRFYIKNIDGTYGSCPEPTSNPDMSSLPPVRYILPYPRAVVTRSMGKYVNKYGYR